VQDATYHAEATSLRVYGFIPNTNLSVTENAINVLGAQNATSYFAIPENMAFHNLCSPSTPVPTGMKRLLGLGLKFCIEPPQPRQYHEHLILTSLDRFSRSVRLHTLLGQVKPKSNETQYIPGLYIPSTWQPPRSMYEIEEPLSRFRNRVEDLTSALPTQRRYNLNTSQRRCLKALGSRPDLVVFPTDKNLGPSVCDRSRYIRQVLSEHLGNPTRYQFLPPPEATTALSTQRARFIALYRRFRYSLPTEAVRTYFERALTDEHLDQTRPPQFYGTFKVHKEGNPKMRPIVSCVNSIPEIFSKWVDFWFKQTVRSLLPTYLRDVEHLLQDLQRFFPNGLPRTARLFSMDAVGMYTNIDTTHGLEQVERFLTTKKDSLPQDMPVEFLLASLREIMSNNIFQFGDTHWRQLHGCAMGTSSAVNYSYLYVGSLEIHTLLPRYRRNLLYYKRFIDDVIGVWLPNPEAPNDWDNFFHDINNFGSLKWTTTGFTNDLTFMDLKIHIKENGEIHTCTHQKELNLYLYIPQGSAHSPSMLRSLIYGRLRAYKLHNTDIEDFARFTTLLAKRLRARGWTKSTLLPLFQEALHHLDHATPTRKRSQSLTPEEPKQLFFHLPYHPATPNLYYPTRPRTPQLQPYSRGFAP